MDQHNITPDNSLSNSEGEDKKILSIKFDGELDISIGRNRNELSWKNKTWQWSAFLQRISATHRTHETYLEYAKANKTFQDETNDVGGYILGYLSGGKRLSSNLLHRSAITMDIDHAAPSLFGAFWKKFTLMYGNAAAIYSTHKHSAETPRYRLILPLSRMVAPDEYEAISRKVASYMGIENFDNTGFQPSRLMYWPSTSIDGIFEFHYQDGPWLDVDAVLASYHDWHDTSEWPIGEGYKATIRNDIKKQGDPLEKPGTIGAWCRTYTIHEVIEKFLPDVYEPCDITDRYTYKEGSTSGGLITYDDKFAYSHHGTDPVSLKLCNAFDLVRIHKFGLRDEDTSTETPVNKKPSYLAMLEFAVTDSDVRKRIGAERLASAREDFADDNFTVPDGENKVLPENMDWIATLEVDRKGNYYATLDNLFIILENDPRLKGCIMYNTFEMRETVIGDLPWRKVVGSGYLTDMDVANLKHYIEKIYKIPCGPKIEDALKVVYSRHSYHPVKEYLGSLTWDGTKRVDTLLIDYLGCEDNKYTRTISRMWLSAAVARIYEPGCKFDYMLLLIGGQGLAKSSFFDQLGGKWFSDSFSTVQGKEAWEQLQGAWIVEVAELSGMRKADVETIKHFISKRKDRYRVAYGRRTEEFARQCVFGGSTNDPTPLKDNTGGRRFLPALVHWQKPTKNAKIGGDLTKAEVDQIWAEAVQLYKAGEKLYLDDEMEAVAKTMQAAHTEQDERTGLVEEYLNTLLPDNWKDMFPWERINWLKGHDELQAKGTNYRERVCAIEIFVECLGGNKKDITPQITKDIHAMMRNMKNWRDCGKARFDHYNILKGYERTNLDELLKEKFSEFNDGWKNNE